MGKMLHFTFHTSSYIRKRKFTFEGKVQIPIGGVSGQLDLHRIAEKALLNSEIKIMIIG